jgi:hypothetical protein
MLMYDSDNNDQLIIEIINNLLGYARALEAILFFRKDNPGQPGTEFRMLEADIGRAAALLELLDTLDCQRDDDEDDNGFL